MQNSWISAVGYITLHHLNAAQNSKLVLLKARERMKRSRIQGGHTKQGRDLELCYAIEYLSNVLKLHFGKHSLMSHQTALARLRNLKGCFKASLLGVLKSCQLTIKKNLVSLKHQVLYHVCYPMYPFPNALACAWARVVAALKWQSGGGCGHSCSSRVA